MRLIFIILLLFSFMVSFGQVTPSRVVKVANATTTFLENIPKGTIIIDISTAKDYITLLPIVSTKSLSTCVLGTDINDKYSVKYEFTVSTAGTTTFTLPFVLKANTFVFYNGAAVADAIWSGIGTTSITLSSDTRVNDVIKIQN